MRILVFRQFLLLCLIILCSNLGYSQNRCSSNLQEKFFEKVPDARNAQPPSLEAWKKKRSHTKRNSVVVTIPVHVIIVYPPGQAVGTGDNLSPERIQSQIDVLNQDFPAINSDLVDVPSMFDVGMSDISFCLASIDPNGNPTDGVTRYATNDSFEDNQFDIMAENIWDNSLYLNIFVTSTIQDLGFSPVPSTSYTIPPMWDAPVVLTTTFGGPGFATQDFYDLGRTTVHEIGHWLGLSHVWGPTNGGCSEDDGMDDTPTQDQPNFACPTHPVADCGNPAVFFMNFMDYVNDECMLAFSEDQVDYMHFIIEEVRPGLIGAHLTKCEDIVAPDPITASLLSSTDESCAGANNGTAEITASGGTPPFSFSLDNGPAQASNMFANISGGNHSIAISDTAGENTSVDFSIGTASPIFIEIVAVTMPCGTLPIGSFGVVATGGNPGALTIAVNQSMTDPNNFFSNLTAGIYTITATDSQNCVEEMNFELTTDQSSIFIEVVDVVMPCGINPTGSFEVQTAPENITITVNQNLTDSNNVFTDLTAGEYSIIAEDDQGCTQELIYTLDVSPNQIQIEVLEVNNPCGTNPNGSFEVQTTPENISVTVNQNLTDPDNTFTDLSAGEYSIVAEDAQGCSQELIYNLEINPDPFLPIQVDVIYPASGDCETDPNSVNVEIISDPSDGINSYILDNGMMSTIGMFDDLSEGTFNYTISNNDGCEATGSFTIESDYYYDIEAQTTEPSCGTDGSISYTNNTNLAISLEVSAGTSSGPASYINIPIGIHMLTVYGEDNCVLKTETIDFSTEDIIESGLSLEPDCDSGLTALVFTASGGSGTLTYELNGQNNTTGQFDDLMPGIVVLEVRDENNCFSLFEIEIFPVDAAMIVNTTIGASTLCAGETTSITIEVIGGAPPYEYIYDGIGQSSNIIENVDGGGHVIEVLSSGDCAEDFSEDIDIVEFEALFVEDINIVDSECSDEGGFFEANIFDGNPPYYYILDNTDTILVDELPRLEDGDHSIQIIDAQGCTSEIFEFETTVSAGITVEVIILNQVSCYGLSNGQIELNVESSIGVSSYEWNVMDLNQQQLGAGDYSVTATNPVGCTSVVDFTITQPDSLAIDTEILTPAGNLSGSAEFTIQGGTAPFLFNVNGIENGDGFFALLQGDYSLDVRDANGCTLNHDFTIELETANENITEELGIQIRPNPTSDLLNISCQLCQLGSTFKVYNVNGKKMTEGMLTQDHALDVNAYAQGFYLLVIESEEHVVVRKFLVS